MSFFKVPMGVEKKIEIKFHIPIDLYSREKRRDKISTKLDPRKKGYDE